MSDRRSAFFAVAASVCFLLAPVAEADIRWVAWATGILYVLLAVLSALDSWSRERHAESFPRGDEGDQSRTSPLA